MYQICIATILSMFINNIYNYILIQLYIYNDTISIYLYIDIYTYNCIVGPGTYINAICSVKCKEGRWGQIT